ncbi:MAG TPA: T9SS type A sorting domain-containing protein [Bacteroidia bacterium]|jgi:hypothetical protein|nr:T9SS type A sorting domain-containing protein [Bacteroidia bacterium]
MKKLLILIPALIFCITASSQTQFIKGWTLWCEYQQNNMQQTSDNGYIMCTDAVPEMDSVNQLAWCYLIKLDVNGNMQWMKKFAKSSYFMKANDGNAVVQTSDGGYAIGTVMYTSNPTTFNSHTAIYVVKVDGNGNLLWSATYPGIGNSSAYCIQETSDLGLIISGNTVDTNTTVSYFYLLRLDNLGNFVWGKTYDYQGTGASLFSVSQTQDGGYITSGSDGSFGVVAKMDQLGNVTWSQRFSNSTTSSENDIIELSNGNGYVSCGSHYNEPGVATLTRFNLAGTPQWSHNYLPPSSVSTSGYDESYSVVESTDGFTLSEAEMSGPGKAKLLHVDTTGAPLWTRDYEYTSYFLPIDLEYCNDGGYAFCSGYYDAWGNWDVSMTKTNSTGITTCHDSLLLDSAGIATMPVAVTLNSASAGQRLPITTTILNENSPSKDYCSLNYEGITELPIKNELSLYPDPADHELYLQLPDDRSQTMNCVVVNSLGQEVWKGKFMSCGRNCPLTIPLDALPNGVYLVRIESDANSRYAGRFIVAH